MENYQCEKCGNIFERKGEVLEYNSPVYGPCSKKVADCPNCGVRSDEYRAPKQTKSKSMSYQEATPSPRGCPAGGCCCSG